MKRTIQASRVEHNKLEKLNGEVKKEQRRSERASGREETTKTDKRTE